MEYGVHKNVVESNANLTISASPETRVVYIKDDKWSDPILVPFEAVRWMIPLPPPPKKAAAKK